MMNLMIRSNVIQIESIRLVNTKCRSSGGQIGYAFKWIVPVTIFSGAIITVCYFTMGYATIPATIILNSKFQTGVLDVNVNVCSGATNGDAVSNENQCFENQKIY
jgi:hypothetical protein